MKKLKSTRIIGIEEARKRLAELEEKHAKALRELQRAEKIHVKSSSRRRRTFHGYPKSHCGIINEVQEVPELSLSQNDKRSNELRPELEIQVGDQGRVSPKADQGVDSDRSRKVPKIGADQKTEVSRKAGESIAEVHLEGCEIPKLGSQGKEGSESPKLVECAHDVHKQKVDGSVVNSEVSREGSKGMSEDSNAKVVCPPVRISAELGVSKCGSSEACLAAESELKAVAAAGIRKKHQNRRRKRCTDPAALPAVSGSCDAEPVCDNENSVGTQGTESLNCQSQNGMRVTGTPSVHKSLPTGNYPDEGKLDGKDFQVGEVIQTESCKDFERNSDISSSISSSGGCEVGHADIGDKTLQESSSSQGSSAASIPSLSNNERWRHLFEEEMPRRSTRLKSKEIHDNVLVCRGKPPKLPRIHQKKKCDNSSRSSPKENKNCHFPKPPVELYKNGGPLNVVVDFSLPDTEFAKLKLDRIRGISNQIKDQTSESNKIINLHGAEQGVLVQQEAKNNDTRAKDSSHATGLQTAPNLLECLPKLPEVAGHQSILSNDLVQETGQKGPPSRQEGQQVDISQNILQDYDPENGQLLAREGKHGFKTKHNPQEGNLISSTVGCSCSDRTRFLSAAPSQATSDRKSCEQRTAEHFSGSECSETNTSYQLDKQDGHSNRGPDLLGLEASFPSAGQLSSMPLSGGEARITSSGSKAEAEPCKALDCPLSSRTLAISFLVVDPALTGADQQVASCSLGGGGSRQGEGSQEGLPGQQLEDGGVLVRPTCLHSVAMAPTNQNVSHEGESVAHLSSIQPCIQDQGSDSTSVIPALNCLKNETLPGVSAHTSAQQSKNGAAAPGKSSPEVKEDDLIKQQLRKDTGLLGADMETQGQYDGCPASAGNFANSQNEKQDTVETVSRPVNHKGLINAEELPVGVERCSAATTVPDQTEDSELSAPVLMQACLEHATEGVDNAIRSVALATYECPACNEMQVDKLEAIAVCLAHLLVIWTALPEQEWTVLHKWALEPDSPEEFCSTQFVVSSSHLIVLAGGLFTTGNGRIYGCSEGAKYCMDLHMENPLSFAAMCILDKHEDPASKDEADVELVLAANGDASTCLTKWTLDSLCLIVKESKPLPVADEQNRLTSLCAVNGNHWLLLGTAADMLLMWNHHSSELLRMISCPGFLTCLSAHTDMGLLFLVAVFTGHPSGESYSEGNQKCAILAVNPLTNKVVCLDSMAATSERSLTAAARGQYMAVVQRQGDACLWNMCSGQRDIQLSVCKDAIRSIGFHKHRPLVAFGSQTGCVHVFSLC